MELIFWYVCMNGEGEAKTQKQTTPPQQVILKKKQAFIKHLIYIMYCFENFGSLNSFNLYNDALI